MTFWKFTYTSFFFTKTTINNKFRLLNLFDRIDTLTIVTIPAKIKTISHQSLTNFKLLEQQYLKSQYFESNLIQKNKFNTFYDQYF